MKKLFALLSVLCLLTVAAVAAFAEAPAQNPINLRNGITFGMTPEQVIAAEGPNCERDTERTPAFVFTKLEYEHVMDQGVPCELQYIFIDNALVAVKANYDKRDASYQEMLAQMTALLGEPVPLDPAALGNAIYAVDDDGHPEFGALGFTFGDMMLVLENDGGDTQVTFMDLSSALAR